MHLKDLYILGKENMRLHLIENPALEASILLSKSSTIKDISEIYAYPEKELDQVKVEEFYRLMDRRIKNEPIAYITGEKEFFSRTFSINNSVLIPRPETELLAEEVIGTMIDINKPVVLDIGTGSGCIAVTIACEMPASTVFASDMSRDVLELAETNKENHCPDSELFFVLGDLADPFKDRAFDIVASNPPYVPESEYRLLSPDVRNYEPRSSLVGGEDGLYFIRKIVSGAARVLKRGGRCLLEVGAGQSFTVETLFREAGFTEVSSVKDINNIDRVVKAQWKK